MRGYTLISFLVVAGISSALSSPLVLEGPTCGHGSPQDIDWDRVPTPLYMAEAVHDPVSEMVICYRTSSISATEDGFRFNDEDYRLANGILIKGQLPLHLIKNATTGGYSLAETDADSFKHEIDEGATEEQIHDLDEEIPQFTYHQIFYFTDYENYVLVTMCGDNDKKFMWIMYTTNHPSEEQFEMVQKKLEDIGGGWDQVEREKTGCNQIECYNGHEEFLDDFPVRHQEDAVDC